MRSTLLAMLCALPACAPCAGPEQVTGVDYDVYATVKTFGTDNENYLKMPTYATPANGWSTWEFQWGVNLNGPITLVIDDQEFTGTGSWNDKECGNFSVEIPDQTYVASSGSEHTFTLSALFEVYALRLEGSGYWAEDWTDVNGEKGTMVAEELQLRGIHPEE